MVQGLPFPVPIIAMNTSVSQNVGHMDKTHTLSWSTWLFHQYSSVQFLLRSLFVSSHYSEIQGKELVAMVTSNGFPLTQQGLKIFLTALRRIKSVQEVQMSTWIDLKYS